MEDQLIPKLRTVGEVMDILSQFHAETPVVGVDGSGNIYKECTIQGNWPEDNVIDNVMIVFWEGE